MFMQTTRVRQRAAARPCAFSPPLGLPPQQSMYVSRRSTQRATASPNAASSSRATSHMATTRAACRTLPQCTTGRYSPLAMLPLCRRLLDCCCRRRRRRLAAALLLLLGTLRLLLPPPAATPNSLAAALGEVFIPRGEAPPSDVRQAPTSEKLPEAR